MSMIEVNLLPRELRRPAGGLRLPKSALIGIGCAALVAAALGGVSFWQSMRLGNVNLQIQKAQAKVESMKEDIELVDRLSNVKRSIAARLEAIETLDRNRGEWVRNLEDIAAVIPDYLWLSSFRRNDIKTKPASGAAAADTTVKATNDYLFEGYCYSLSSLANLILNMQDSPRFERVALKRATYTDVKERKVYQFTVFCLLQPVDRNEGTGDQPAVPTRLGTGPEAEEPVEVSAYDETMDGGE